MARLICLANSIRSDGRCVAGIDIETGEWVRPVPPGGGGIPYPRTCIQGQPAALLDILEIDLTTRNPGTKYQCENRVMRNRAWRRVGQIRPKSLLTYCDDTTPILHSKDDRVAPEFLDALPPEQWTSLQLVHPKRASFARDSWNPNRWRASFRDAVGNHYSLKVTDPVVCGRLNHDERIGADCVLTVSLPEPWSPDDSTPEMCYKLVAAIIEL